MQEWAELAGTEDEPELPPFTIVGESVRTTRNPLPRVRSKNGVHSIDWRVAFLERQRFLPRTVDQ